MSRRRVDESSFSFDLTDHNIGLEPRSNTSYLLSIEEDKNSRKFKWQSGCNELKSFVNDELSLSGQWSSVSKSGGFLVLKANGVTLSFYPKTKTLNVQGAKQEEVTKKLLSLLSRGNLNIDANEQVLNEQHVGQKQTDDEDVDVLPNDGDNEVIQPNHDEPAYHEEQAFHHCPGCKENADASNGLKQEFVKLNEQLKTRVFTPSYDELLLRIKTLEEERDSLVTTLRILSEDVKERGSNTNTVDLNDEQQASKSWETVQPKKEKNPPGHKGVASGNNITSQSKQDQNKPPGVVVIGDSITRNIIGKKLSRNQNVNAFSFSGATIDDMVDFAKPVIKRKPKKIILHVGTNNLKMDQPKKIKNKVAGLVDSIKAEHPSIDVAVSSIIFRSDDQSLNSKIDEVNRRLSCFCQSKNWVFIDNSNIREDSLNRKGMEFKSERCLPPCV